MLYLLKERKWLFSPRVRIDKCPKPLTRIPKTTNTEILMFIPWHEIYFCCKLYTEKAMAPHSSTLAWKIPRTEEPGGLQSMGSIRVGHDWATSLSLFTFMHWRRKWQPTPVFLPGEPQGRGSLVGCCLWGRRVGHDWSDLAAAAAANFIIHF